MTYCPAISGTWRPENGVVIASEFECGRTYDNDAAFFARDCERNFIPTGVAVPTRVWQLAVEAWTQRAYPALAERFWTAAREALANAAVEMADA